jgi:glutaredoxin
VSVEVRVYSAAGCHLCDVAKEVLEAERDRLGFDLVEVDISGDPQLEAAHREEIPVVFVAGRKAFKFRVDPAELRRRVEAAAAAGEGWLH